MKPEVSVEIIKGIEEVEGILPEEGLLVEEALNMAVEALEKQIPKEPVEGYIFRDEFRKLLKKKHKDMADRKGSCCPRCGEHIGESEAILKRKNYHPYCKWCGQALKKEES